MYRLFSSKSTITKSPKNNVPRQLQELPFELEQCNGLLRHKDQLQLVAGFRYCLTYQLELLAQALNLSSAVLLWWDAPRLQLFSYAWSEGSAPLAGPFDPAEGILGTLKIAKHIALSPWRSASPALPWNGSCRPVGSVYAQLVEGEEDQSLGVLCLERSDETPWSAADKRFIDQCSGLIDAEYRRVKNHLYVDFERQALQQVFDGLRTLNAGLGAESVYNAAVAAIGCVVDVDIVAVSSVHDGFHHFDFVSEAVNFDLATCKFRLENSIVAQAIKYRRIMPDTNSAATKTAVVDQCSEFDSYQSLLVLPLYRDEHEADAVLIVAAHAAHRFARSTREMLEMIAAQLAIKLELAKAHDQINALTFKDSLSGIANRRAFERALEAMAERSLRRSTCFSLILCDIDHFKGINDSYGHPFGDQVICQIASQLDSIVRSGDLAARIGGEEFALLLEDADGKGASEVAERVRRKVENLVLKCNREQVQVTLSLGIAVFPTHSSLSSELIVCSDQALYRAKQGGRNRFKLWR